MRYPEWSERKVASHKWWPNRMDLSVYAENMWECASCGAMHRLTPYCVFLEGSNMRLQVGCGHCERWSVVRVRGFFKPRLITEASLPPDGDDVVPSEFARIRSQSGPGWDTQQLQADAEMLTYIDNCRAEGCEDEAIAQQLRDQGWEDEIVQKALLL